MHVSAWNRDRSTYGIRIGARSRDAHFRPDWGEIEVEIDGTLHYIPITRGFWNRCPQFRSPVIRDYLRKKGLLRWPRRSPPQLELVPLGSNRFRLVTANS